MARLQTFPTDVTIVGSYADAQRQLGNAVPSLLAGVLAREIGSQLLGRRSRSELPLAVKPSTSPPPPASKPAALPSKYLSLKGEHRAHPGTGKGYRAVQRDESLATDTEELFELHP
jgi:DNA (cytosine-5)-methyltransferase 1